MRLAYTGIMSQDSGSCSELALSFGATLTWYSNAGEGAPAILLVPGGPGLKSDYLLPLVKSLTSQFSVIGFEYPITGDDYQQALSDSLNKALALVGRAGDLILCGHSAGAMLLLKPWVQLPTNTRHIILISGAPDGKWSKASETIMKKISFPGLQEAESKFKSGPTPELLRQLFVSWAPFYFPPSSMENGRKYLDTLNYRTEPFLLRGTVFSSAHTAGTIPDRIVITLLHGEQDHLTPANGYAGSAVMKHKRLESFVIPSSGHFPWVESPEQVTNLLTRRIISSIKQE
jgi:pimeloyl-ACP methyl ester carboxylesterase